MGNGHLMPTCCDYRNNNNLCAIDRTSTFCQKQDYEHDKEERNADTKHRYDSQEEGSSGFGSYDFVKSSKMPNKVNMPLDAFESGSLSPRSGRSDRSNS